MTSNAKVELVYLIINMNGTSAKELLNDLLKMGRAANALLDSLRLGRPHGRDYQHYKDDSFKRASDQHEERIAVIERVKGEIEAMAEHIQRSQR